MDGTSKLAGMTCPKGTRLPLASRTHPWRHLISRPRHPLGIVGRVALFRTG
jgi:hypothetical protein